MGRLQETDRVLVDRLLSGDEDAFDEFFESTFNRTYRFALSRVGRREDAAEDIAQATLGQAVRRLGTWRGEASLFTWICTIGRREIEAWRRVHPAERAVELVQGAPEIRASLESLRGYEARRLEAALARQELAALIQRILDRLPVSYGNVLEWKYLDNEPVREIAARLAVTENAAESLLTRARDAFREMVLSIAPGLDDLRREFLREY